MRLKIYIVLATVIPFIFSCAKKDNDELSHHHDHAHENHEGHAHGHADEGGHQHDDDEISLEESVAELFGLETEKAEVRDISAAVKVGATVETASQGNAAAIAPTAGVLTLTPGIEVGSKVAKGSVIATVSAAGVTGGDANAVALAELNAAKTEYERAQALYADRLITLTDFNAAKKAYEIAKASYSAPASSGKITAPISGVITGFDVQAGSFVEKGAPVATIYSDDRLLIKADVPAKSYPMVSAAVDARIVPTGSHDHVFLSNIDGKRVDNGPAAMNGGFIPVTFSVKNDGCLIPGQPVELFLLGKADHKALAVKSSALSEQQGSYFVYVRIDEDCYKRIPVAIGPSDGLYTEIRSGLKGGEDVVVSGVTAVKLAQTAGAVPEGHSHSH